MLAVWWPLIRYFRKRRRRRGLWASWVGPVLSVSALFVVYSATSGFGMADGLWLVRGVLLGLSVSLMQLFPARGPSAWPIRDRVPEKPVTGWRIRYWNSMADARRRDGFEMPKDPTKIRDVYRAVERQTRKTWGRWRYVMPTAGLLLAAGIVFHFSALPGLVAALCFVLAGLFYLLSLYSIVRLGQIRKQVWERQGRRHS